MDNKIDGFEWHLPLAFKDSVAQCKFEQGDVIYKSTLKDSSLGIIQVRTPSRSYISNGGDLNVFESNWNSKITFEMNDFSLTKIIETTQGRFFTFLWKNEESILHDNKPLPPVQTSVASKQMDFVFLNSKIPYGWTGFAIITDSVSNLIISKRNGIMEALTKKFNVQVEQFKLDEALNFDANSMYSPTLGVELFKIESVNSEEIKEEIKAVLFKGIKNKFNINIHGLFIENPL